jgi:PadR family transcriptional regulator
VSCALVTRAVTQKTGQSGRIEGTFDLPEGTVYPALHRLEAAGLLTSTWDQTAGRRRRVYRLTAAGQESLADQARQWRSFSGAIALVVGGTA